MVDDASAHQADPSEAGGKTAPGIRQTIFLLIPALLVILVYAATTGYPFIFDDIPNIVDNPAIRLARLDASGLWQAAFQSPHPRRPVANVSFALNYRFHGYAVAGYHWVNILVHLTTGMIFYLLAAQTLRLSRTPGPGGQGDSGPPPSVPSGGPTLVALTAATLWMVHPLQTQSVTYIVQRMNSLAALFYLLSMLFYVRARTALVVRKRVVYFSAAVLAGLLAVGSKEIAITLPFFLFLYEWFFFQDLDRRWLQRQWPWMALLVVAGTATLWVCLGDDPLNRILVGYRYRAFSPAERLLTQPRVVLFYLSLLAFPHPARLNLDHNMAISGSLLTPPTTLAALLALAGMLVWAVSGARRHRLMRFALLWYLGNLVIESSAIGLELVFEHRNYLPGTFLFLALTDGASRIGFGRRTRAMVLGALVLCLGIWTLERNRVWQNDLTLWRDCAAKSPQKPRPNNKLGVALEKRGRLAEAERQFRYVIALDPAHPYAYFNLANTLARRGRSAEAVENYQKSLVLVPDNPGARINLGVALAGLGRVPEALESLSIVGPGHGAYYGMARKNMGLILFEAGKFDDAIFHFQAALAVAPDDSALLVSIGNAHFKAGRMDQATAQYHAALQYAPDSAGIHNNLGIVLMSQGLYRQAVVEFEKAASLEPRNPDFSRNLGMAKVRGGHGDE
ncbi:MAG: tetratricopeptide repeat protein [Desulfobacterales bacterium]|nr:tetratricopeptide repeat protein [Desulfobacterales bacterium]